MKTYAELDETTTTALETALDALTKLPFNPDALHAAFREILGDVKMEIGPPPDAIEEGETFVTFDNDAIIGIFVREEEDTTHFHIGYSDGCDYATN